MSAKDGSISINFSKYNYNLGYQERIVQLSALFHVLKKKLGSKVYAEICNEKGNKYIPYSFCLNETLALCKLHNPELWYLELDENNYIEIRRENIKICGLQDFFDFTLDTIERGSSYITSFDMFVFDYKIQKNNQAWQNFFNEQYTSLVKLGDNIFKNGNMTVYPIEEDEFFVYDEADFYKIEQHEIEYITLRSNIDINKTLLVNNTECLVVATGMTIDEQDRLALSLQ